MLIFDLLKFCFEGTRFTAMPLGGVTVWFQRSHILVYLLVTACSIVLYALITENTYLLFIINNIGGVAGRKTRKKQLPEELTF